MPAHNCLYKMFAAPFRMKDPGDAGTIRIDRWGGTIAITSSSSNETRTLAQPTKPNMACMVILDTDGGGEVTLTVTGGGDGASATSFVLDDAGDYIAFRSIQVAGAYYWRVTDHYGVENVNTGDGLTWNGSYLACGPQSGLWRYSPSRADGRYNRLVHEYFNDFRASSADYDATNEWTLTEDDAACTQAITADAVCGELLLTNKATTDDNAQQINLNQESFKLASGKKLWFETRFKTAAGATQIDWTVGLVEAEDLTGVTDNMPANGIVFHKDDGATATYLSSSDNGTNLGNTSLGTWDTSYHVLGFYFDGGATGSGIITPYVDGTAGTAVGSITYATMAELAPIFMVRNGDATTTQTMTIDYVRVVQLR